MDDVTLTFNPNLFLKGLDAINKGIQTMNTNFSKSQTMSVKNQSTMKLSAFNLMGVIGKIGIAIGVIRGVLNKIPEIGRTFSIAGDIFMRNFLWPLRLFLLPILQKVLDWVRDNRAMFVRWGNVVANIFRAIFNIVKQLYKIIKGMWETLISGMENIFGRSVRSVNELANIILFKITAVVQFILITLEPFFQLVVRRFLEIVRIVRSFIEGFLEGLGDLSPELDDMVNSLRRIWTVLSNIGDRSLPYLIRGFRILGNVLSMVVGPVLRGIGQLLDTIASGLEALGVNVAIYRARQAGNLTEVRRLRAEERALGEQYRRRTIERWGRQGAAWSGAATNIRNIWNQPSESPQSTRVNPSGTTNNNSVTNNVNNRVNISVEGATNPQATGEEVERRVRGILREQRFRGGSR